MHAFTMLSNMHNNMIGEFEEYPTAQDMWKVLKMRDGRTSATRLHELAMRFDFYQMCSR